MTIQVYGTLAALEFAQPPQHGFEDIVEEVDISFQPVGLTRRSLIRDSEDIAIVERDNLRVLLGWLPPAEDTEPFVLVLAVGPSPDRENVFVTQETCAFVKDLLLTHLRSYLSFDTVFHADATQPVRTELVDTIAEILHSEYQRSAPEHHIDPTTTLSPFDPVHHTAEDIWSSFGRARSTRSQPNTPGLQPGPECSLPKRLTIYTLGATMLIYTPPVGATLLVYSTLRDFLPTGALHV